MGKLIVQSIAFAVFTLFANAAFAGDCGVSRCWGAVAVGPNGAWGWSNAFATENGAINRAQNGCQWDCDVVRTFYNTCGAISKASNGGWGFGWASSRAEAEDISLGYCYENGNNCEVQVWACSH